MPTASQGPIIQFDSCVNSCNLIYPIYSAPHQKPSPPPKGHCCYRTRPPPPPPTSSSPVSTHYVCVGGLLFHVLSIYVSALLPFPLRQQRCIVRVSASGLILPMGPPRPLTTCQRHGNFYLGMERTDVLQRHGALSKTNIWN